MKKRKDGRYKRSIVTGFTPDGKEKRAYVYGSTKKEVEQKISEIRVQLERGTYIENTKLTVSEWADSWLNTYKTGVEYNTHKMYSDTIKRYIKPHIGEIPLIKLKTYHIQDMINREAERGLGRTLQQIELTMNQMITQAINNDLIYKDITTGVTLPQINAKKKRALTELEKKYIEKANFSLKEKAFIFLLLHTGLRRGEALALMRNDIDFNSNTIRISKTVIYKENNAEVKFSPKTESGNRELPMVSILQNILSEYLQTTNKMFVFAQDNGEIMSKSSFRRFWNNIMDKINTAAGGQNYNYRGKYPLQNKKVVAISDDITPHTFRHTFATTLYYAGVDIKTAQYLLGHNSIQVTLDIYTHLEKSNTNDTINKLEKFLCGSLDNIKSTN